MTNAGQLITEEHLKPRRVVKIDFPGKEKLCTRFNTECIERGNITEKLNGSNSFQIGPLAQLVRAYEGIHNFRVKEL